MKQLLAERADRIALLEARVENLDQLVEGYRSREQSVVDALSNAHVAAKQRITDAEQKADAILSASQSRADKALSEAQAAADKLLQSAKEESERMLQQAEATLAEYEALFQQYNEAIDRSVRQAKAGAEEYAAFLQARRLDADDAALFATENLSGTLPDPSDSPAQLMHNIYRLQNRDIPAEAPAVRPAAAPAAEPAAAAEPATVAETIVTTVAEPEPEAVIVAEPVAAYEPAPAPLTTPAPKPVYAAPAETPSAEEGAYVPEAEWLPSEDVPTVSTLVSDIGDDDVSLDQLLDEIICSGE